MSVNLEDLTSLFREAGARDPAGWAQSQLQEGINHLHRFLFLRQAWSAIVDENDMGWIDAEIAAAERGPTDPYSGVGKALQLLLNQGADRQLLNDIVRGMQAQLLFRICYLLEDPSLEQPELSEFGWRLVETDENNEPTTTPICGLHESVLETDPSGREMRPREQ